MRAADAIALRVGAVINRYKDHKHFVCETHAYGFAYRREQDSIDHDSALAGDLRLAAGPGLLDGLISCRQESTW